MKTEVKRNGGDGPEKRGKGDATMAQETSNKIKPTSKLKRKKKEKEK